jgi:hypothetical protein
MVPAVQGTELVLLLGLEPTLGGLLGLLEALVPLEIAFAAIAALGNTLGGHLVLSLDQAPFN